MAVQNGRFYFKITSNGNLLGEYSNSGMEYSGTESAVRLKEGMISEERLLFTGTFATCWLEDYQHANYAELTISMKKDKNGRVIPNSNFFDLKWKRGGKLQFEGEGMLCDNILIGCYK